MTNSPAKISVVPVMLPSLRGEMEFLFVRSNTFNDLLGVWKIRQWFEGCELCEVISLSNSLITRSVSFKTFCTSSRKPCAERKVKDIYSQVVTLFTIMFSIQKFYIQLSECSSVFRIDLRTNSDYIPTQL